MSLDSIKVQDTSNWFRKAKNDIRAAELLVADSGLLARTVYGAIASRLPFPIN